MLRLGLTGGIASGKSVVAAMLREMGFAVLDADALGHKLMNPGQPAYGEILREFGSSVLDDKGRIDRAKLAVIVFADRAKLNRLNTILHPRIEEAMHLQFDEWQQEGGHNAVFVEAALLVEAGYYKKLDGLVVVWCKPEQQLERLTARGLSETEARQRMAAQLPVAEKLQHATEEIDCSGSIESTCHQIEALAVKLRSHIRR